MKLKRLFTALSALLLCVVIQPCHSSTQTSSIKGKQTMVKLHTNLGTITLQLDAEKAPEHSQEFSRLRE